MTTSLRYPQDPTHTVVVDAGGGLLVCASCPALVWTRQEEQG